jgi:hypothetical protein
MKKLLLIICVLVLPFLSLAQNEGVAHNAPSASTDTIKLSVEGTNAYYQHLVKVDSNIKVSTIYTRTLEFMAAKNFQQNYGYEQEGKLIYTTTQDMNENAVYNDSDNDNPQPYTVQFSIIIDMKNGRYRYTVKNVIFYLPTDNGNRKLTLYEVHQKEGDDQPKRVSKDAKKLIDSFEKYLGSLTFELYTEVEHKASIYNSKF